MSLINDALKRAKQTQPLPPPVAPGPPMTPVEHKRRAQWPLVVVPVLLLAVVIVAVWFFWAASQTRRKGSSADGPTKVAAREKDSVAHAGAAPVDDLTARVGQHSSPTATDTAQLAATNTAPTLESAGPVDPPKRLAPAFKLQAIFYRPKNPSAVINSKTVFRGDKVAEAKVLAIDRESVTLVANGQTNVLTLP